MKRMLPVLLLAAAACGTPGSEISIRPDDFAMVEIQLQG